ncbi:ERF family protein [Candidatus Pacearchaeota archaeon]|nr:ERF family protein [Candidatus Pacearchaeota archaeon]
MNDEIEKVETQAIQLQTDAPPMVQIAQLLANGVDIDVDKMAKMQEMSERYERNEARKSFARSFASVQSEVEAVVRTKKNSQTNSNYATLENVLHAAKPIYTKHGFSVIFSEGKADSPDDIRVCADVLHADGHEKTYHTDVAMDDKGIKGSINKTKVHGKASSLTYGRRYLMCMIWNIPTPDNDGNAPKDEKPIEYPKPTDDEQAVIDKVTELLIDIASQQGRVPTAELVAHIMYKVHAKYPDASMDIPKIANWLAGKYLVAVTEKL